MKDTREYSRTALQQVYTYSGLDLYAKFRNMDSERSIPATGLSSVWVCVRELRTNV
jgi:hypothetical protein